ncbi:MFS transporter [Jannaschia aquimarina]|uniref:YcaD protein n=1 Tax=Jannaschia aquimarina TaxID=935700 RepID=A0A0D1EJM1_9RHOB|nr:MFS transporter [Jannaschia aquimarina]KIT17186.1 putative MFS-type transporter YcaD [Jannaschia aquimarina]SNT18048.1 Predicted arabinose efflux permease, MFS family [Jannaschia aquimarina]
MLTVIRQSWPLFIGITLLMIGNGVQGTLLGVRGDLEGFSTGAMSIVMSSYFAGFLLGSRFVPGLIRKVGHVRVFAALGSLASAGLILFPLLTEAWAWIALRLLIGFCFCGIYIVAESWLNNSTTTETRGRALSLYIIAQMVGIVAAQAIFAFGDPSGFELFVIVSVLVSLAFAPILLAATPVPPFERTKPMSFLEVYRVSPLGVVGVFLMGGFFSAAFGMVGVYGAQAGLTGGQIATFAAAIYVGGMLLQYPIGWLSDRTDRRRLIVSSSAVAALACGIGALGLGGFPGLLVSAFVMGGMANPLYALLLAYTNDYLDYEDMASASAQLLFVNGLGAVGGPLLTGWLMGLVGPAGFFFFVGGLMVLMSCYALYRMTQRPAYSGEEAAPYVAVSPTVTTPVTMETVVEEWEDQIHGEDAEPDDRAA